MPIKRKQAFGLKELIAQTCHHFTKHFEGKSHIDQVEINSDIQELGLFILTRLIFFYFFLNEPQDPIPNMSSQ